MDNAPKLPEFKDYITGVEGDPESVGIQTWLGNTAKAESDQSLNRGWCTLDLTGLKKEDLAKFFDRSLISEKYEEEYTKNSKSGKPFGFLQTESDLIYSMHKCFDFRHKSRLTNYRDDCAQKKYHIFSAISLGVAKHNNTKIAAEKGAERRVNNSITTV